MSTVIERAHADLDAGRPWMARDRLVSALRDRQDDEVLNLLAEVHEQLGDLPAAGALWFVTGLEDDRARTALEAWRERHPGERARWNSIPSPVRRHARAPQLIALREDATRVSRAGTAPAAEVPDEAWWEPVVVGGGCLLVVAGVLALIVIGAGTVWGWLWG